jgi:shikimate kinase
MNNIILTGMPGAGKSTVGVILAKVLGYDFIDSDIVIQKRYNKKLREIIAEDGVDGFIAKENYVNSSIEAVNAVIATGGSAIYGKEAMEHFKNIGKIVYIKLDYEIINKRLGDIKRRGVVLKDGQSLLDLYNERCPLYEKYADIIVNTSYKSIEDTLEEIINEIEIFTNSKKVV